ncbi:MAG: hypothetical protein OEZ06_31385 [Myxococcales bacterium]|nr:hypothetical protein [Myxococcales bacterium]
MAVWIGFAVVIGVLASLSACRQPARSSRALLANRSSKTLRVVVVAVSGECEPMWEFGEAMLREDDFVRRSVATAEPGQAEQRGTEVPPGTLVALTGCAARLSFDEQVHTLIWDPGLKPITRAVRPLGGLEHRQIVSVVDARGGRELRFSDAFRALAPIAAHEPLDPGPCAEELGPPLEASRSGTGLGGILTAVTEHGDGCMTLDFSAAEGGDGGANTASNIPPEDADGGMVDIDAAVALAADANHSQLHLCIERKLLPVAPGMAVDVQWEQTDHPGLYEGLVIRPAGELVPRLTIVATEVNWRGVTLPRFFRPAQQVGSALPSEPVEVSPADCGWLRTDVGEIWRAMEVSLDGTPLPAGQPVRVGDVTFITRRALRPILSPAQHPPDSGRIEWIEVHHAD